MPNYFPEHFWNCQIEALNSEDSFYVAQTLLTLSRIVRDRQNGTPRDVDIEALHRHPGLFDALVNVLARREHQIFLRFAMLLITTAFYHYALMSRKQAIHIMLKSIDLFINILHLTRYPGVKLQL